MVEHEDVRGRRPFLGDGSVGTSSAFPSSDMDSRICDNEGVTASPIVTLSGNEEGNDDE